MINRAVRKYIYIIVKFVKNSIRYILRYSFDWEKIIGRRIPWEGIKEIGIEISRDIERQSWSAVRSFEWKEIDGRSLEAPNGRDFVSVSRRERYTR